MVMCRIIYCFEMSLCINNLERISNNRIDGIYHDQTHSSEYQEDYFGEFKSVLSEHLGSPAALARCHPFDN